MNKIIFLFPVVFFVIQSSINYEEDPFVKYLFIEQRYLLNSELNSGTKLPLTQTDFPSYSFALYSGKLYGVINLNVENSFEVISGSGICLTETVRAVCSTDLKRICLVQLIKGDFELLKFDETRKIIFTSKSQIYSLNTAVKWTLVKTNFHKLPTKVF